MHNKGEMKMHQMHYRKLLIMIIISFAAMYLLMYSMVDTLANVIPNVNQIYMAALMTAAMVIIEIILMWSMYKNKKLNVAILIMGSVVLVASFLFIRYQTAVGEKQFLKSMIPHHAAAILMVKETSATDPEILQLQSDIVSSQQKEIEFMKKKLKEMENK